MSFCNYISSHIFSPLLAHRQFQSTHFWSSEMLDPYLLSYHFKSYWLPLQTSDLSSSWKMHSYPFSDLFQSPWIHDSLLASLIFSPHSDVILPQSSQSCFKLCHFGLYSWHHFEQLWHTSLTSFMGAIHTLSFFLQQLVHVRCDLFTITVTPFITHFTPHSFGDNSWQFLTIATRCLLLLLPQYLYLWTFPRTSHYWKVNKPLKNDKPIFNSAISGSWVDTHPSSSKHADSPVRSQCYIPKTKCFYHQNTLYQCANQWFWVP